MKRHVYAVAAVAWLGTAAQAFGQGYYYNAAPAKLQVEGGAAVTTGTTGTFLDNGWTVGAGFMWHPAPGPLALRTTLDYTRLPATQQSINSAAAANMTPVNGGFGEVVSVRLNGVYEWPVSPYSPYTRAYITAGVGGVYENVEFTQTTFTPGFACSWWVCGTALFAQQSLVARNDVTKFSWNAGVGLDFSVGGWQSWFVEATFEKVNTPQPTTFVPIRVGFRF
jgi:hypothetical protein